MYDDLTYRINGGIFAVHSALGSIWPEAVYETALTLELRERGLHVESQQEFEVAYFGKRVGAYRIDLLVDQTVIVELKAVPDLLPLHRAQVLSYLKGFDKPIGILANFGHSSAQHVTLPNHLAGDAVLTDRFDADQLTLDAGPDIAELLVIANRVLTTLGPGYLAQVYRRALFHEFRTSGVEFETMKQVTAMYRNQPVGARPVNFLKVGDLLIAVLTVQSLDTQTLSRFRQYFRHVRCRRGIVFNFHATTLDFRYLER